MFCFVLFTVCVIANVHLGQVLKLSMTAYIIFIHVIVPKEDAIAANNKLKFTKTSLIAL